MSLSKSFCTKKSGFTLIEVLITVVILSIGLLGMAGIQIQGLRGTTSSTVRSQATILANDLAERIRMNRGGVFIAGVGQNQHYMDLNITANTFACGDAVAPTFCSVTQDIPSDETIASCDTTQMTAFDIYEIACGLGHDAGIRNLLPEGTVTTSCNDVLNNCPPGSELTISIGWTENNPSTGQPEDKIVSMVVIP